MHPLPKSSKGMQESYFHIQYRDQEVAREESAIIWKDYKARVDSAKARLYKVNVTIRNDVKDKRNCADKRF